MRTANGSACDPKNFLPFLPSSGFRVNPGDSLVRNWGRIADSSGKRASQGDLLGKKEKSFLPERHFLVAPICQNVFHAAPCHAILFKKRFCIATLGALKLQNLGLCALRLVNPTFPGSGQFQERNRFHFGRCSATPAVGSKGYRHTNPGKLDQGRC
jgi:hypothetical protein